MSTLPDRPTTPRHIRAELGQALRDLGLDDDTDDSLTGPSSPHALPPGTPIGRYTILGQIGHGGQGEVYSVYDPELDRRVALKRIRGDHGSPVLRARLMREAQALARLEHPNVLRVHDTGTHAGSPYLVMEYKTSQSLSHWLSTAPHTWREILQKFLAAGRGLHAAHTAELVHRDIKPENIFLDDHVDAVLGDFGLAFGLDEDPQDPTTTTESRPRPALLEPVTETGEFPGTEGYIAPEAMSGRATRSSDQYSFCVALFHALFGVLPHPDEQRTPTRPRDDPPPQLTRALHRGLSRDPAARFPDIATLLTALDVPPEPPRSTTRRNALAAAAALTLSTGVGLAWAYAPDPCRIAARTDIDSVWNTDRRTTISEAFNNTYLPYAHQTGQSFIQFADDYHDRWLEARNNTCDAPSPVIESCLDHQRTRFDSLLSDYTTPTPSQVTHALDAATHLDPPTRCRDSSSTPQPNTPEDLRTALDHAELKIISGDYKNAAKDLAALPTSAETNPKALWLAAWLAATIKPDRYSDELLKKAAYAAALAHDHDTFARAATYRLKSLALDLGEPAEAAMIDPWVKSLVAQWPHETTLHQWLDAELAEARGMRLDAEGDYTLAAAQHRIALAQRTKLDGPNHPRVAKSHHNLAVSLAYANDDEALDHYLEALQIRRQQLGDDHPQTLETVFGVAQVECQLLEPYSFYDPNILADCTADLATTFDKYSEQILPDPRGLFRRAIAIAYHSVDAERFDRAQAALADAHSIFIDIPDASLRERSDLITVRGKLATARHDYSTAFIDFMAAAALYERADRLSGIYIQLLDSAVRVAAELYRHDDAANVLLNRTIAIAHASCPIRMRHAQQLEEFAAFIGPARRVADLLAAATNHSLCLPPSSTLTESTFHDNPAHRLHRP